MSRPVFSASLLALAGVVAFAPSPVRADDHLEVFGGVQNDYSTYGYLGVTAALPGSAIGRGVAVRGLYNIGGYTYTTNPLGTVHAQFNGGELDALYQISSSHFWSDFGVGVAYDDTALSPDDLSNRRRGPQTEMRLDLDGGLAGGAWRTDWTGYYGTRLYDYALRVGATHAVSANWRLGIEAYTEGDPTYHLNEIGPYAGIALNSRGELQVGGGFAQEGGLGARGYVRASFYQRI